MSQRAYVPNAQKALKSLKTPYIPPKGKYGTKT